MKLLTAAALALATTFAFGPEVDAQFSRKDYPQDRDRERTTASSTASSRSTERARSIPSRERTRATTREPSRTTRATTRARDRAAARVRTRPATTPNACPPPRVVTAAPRRATRVVTAAPRRATRVVYRERDPVVYTSGAFLSRGERRAYQQRLTARAERLARWETELLERRARRDGRDVFVSRRERRAIAERYFPYGNAGVLRARELREWELFLEDEAVALSRREEALRGRRDRNRRDRNRNRRDRNRGGDYCPPGGW